MIIFTQRVSLLAHSLSVACRHVAHLNDAFSLKMLGTSKAWAYEKLRLSQLKHLDSKSLEKVVCWKPPKICFLNKKCLLRKKDWHPCFVIRSSNNNSNKINNNINKTTSTTSSAQVFDWKHLNKDVADIRSGGLSRVVTNLTFSDFLLEWSSSFTPDISCLNNSRTLSHKLTHTNLHNTSAIYFHPHFQSFCRHFLLNQSHSFLLVPSGKKMNYFS